MRILSQILWINWNKHGKRITYRRLNTKFECHSKNWASLICQKLLTQYEAEEDALLKCILICDETWVHLYILKWSSQVWNAIAKWNCFRKGKTEMSAGMVLARVFWEYRVVVYIGFLINQRTINVAYYCTE